MVILFRADEIAMLPLYALGVMLSFTLSQAGMARLMSRVGQLKLGESQETGATTIHHEKNWRWKQLINVVGSLTTVVVFVILVATKFLDGAWLIALAIPALVYMFHKINQHYEDVSEALTTKGLVEGDLVEIANVAVVPIADIHRGTLRALKYAKRIATDVRAVAISTSPAMRERIEERWRNFPIVTEGIKLVIIDYDFRDILTPLVDYIEDVHQREFRDELMTVVIPEFVAEEAMARLLHNQTANFLQNRLMAQEGIIIIDVPYHIHHD
jgi:hypothetical protein